MRSAVAKTAVRPLHGSENFVPSYLRGDPYTKASRGMNCAGSHGPAVTGTLRAETGVVDHTRRSASVIVGGTVSRGAFHDRRKERARIFPNSASCLQILHIARSYILS